MFFPDPDKPIITCVSESCDDCNVSHAVHCHFKPKDLIHFLCIVLPGFLLGGAGIYNLSGSSLVFWILIMVGYFGFVEIRVMCSHCPHYAEKCSSLKCWANYGSPKIWKYRPGPMSFMEKVIFLGGFTIIWGYPFPFLLAGMQWFLLLVYIFSVAGFFMTLRMFLCAKCMNFACPLNTVDENTRQEFFTRNPEIAKAWSQDRKG